MYKKHKNNGNARVMPGKYNIAHIKIHKNSCPYTHKKLIYT